LDSKGNTIKTFFIIFTGRPSKESRENGGLFVNQTKYRVVRYDPDLDACYLKGPGSTGACIQRTKQTIVFCAFDKKNKG
jgi:hypothetical protein